jgi:hypothetical protein
VCFYYVQCVRFVYRLFSSAAYVGRCSVVIATYLFWIAPAAYVGRCSVIIATHLPMIASSELTFMWTCRSWTCAVKKVDSLALSWRSLHSNSVFHLTRNNFFPFFFIVFCGVKLVSLRDCSSVYWQRDSADNFGMRSFAVRPYCQCGLSKND